jgi:predicted nucleic acid-binding protein
MPGAEALAALFVLDASVAVRWVVPEQGSHEAAALLEEPLAWIAPRLMLSEAAGALRRKVAGGELALDVAVQALDVLVDATADGAFLLADDEQLVRPALLLAVSLGHKVPDCIYLALAEREGAGLATADARLADLARRRGIEARAIATA